MNIRRTVWVFLIAMAVVTASGCERIKPKEPGDGWSTETSMSAVEYSMFLSGEISTVDNVLMTRISMAKSVMDEAYETDKEIQNTEESISKVASVVDEITMTMPAVDYESDRQNVLDLTEDARLALVKYKEQLEAGNIKDLDSNIEELKGCMIALGGAVNQVYA